MYNTLSSPIVRPYKKTVDIYMERERGTDRQKNLRKLFVHA